MTQEEKELLLKDLCARLPYGVICTDSRHGNSRITEVDIVDETVYCFDFDEYSEIKYIKPYLRPWSSMTEEEKETYEMFLNEDGLLNTSVDTYLEWLLDNHFDYRGLIPMGLAIEAPNNMYNT